MVSLGKGLSDIGPWYGFVVYNNGHMSYMVIPGMKGNTWGSEEGMDIMKCHKLPNGQGIP